MSSRPLRVFVSATSRDLGSTRRAVFEVLTTLGISAIQQDHFSPDHREIRDMLRAKIAECDAVVHVAGRVYGGEPAPTPDAPRRSYTQLEVEIADELRKPVYVFLAAADYPFDAHDPEPEELAQLQKDHHARLRSRTQKWEEVSGVHHLQARVAVTPFPGLRRFADPHKPTNLPFDTLGTLFKGRDEFLVRLWQSLESGGGKASAVVAKQAIHGLGGVGKTRAAVEYAHRFADRYSALLFVNADSPLTLTQGLAQLCGPKVLNLPEQDEANLSRQEAAALRWLGANPGWFLILDNVDTDEAASAVDRLLPQLREGHVVITSRLSNWTSEVEPLELDVLDESPAAAFLLERTHGKRKTAATDPADAAQLARDLGCLALALEQAGAFVARHRCSLSDYRERWRKHEAKMLDWLERSMRYPRSVATTWQTSIDEMSNDGRGLLNVLAWLAPELVPLTMLAKLGTPEGAAPIAVEAGCADLAAYSLVKWNADSTAVKAHRLVLDITRYRTPEPARRGWLERALALVDDFVDGDPQDVRTWKDVYDPVSDHAIVVIAHADSANIPEPTSRLMNQMGVYFNSQAEYTEAEPLFRRALAIDENYYGLDHPNVALKLNNLGLLLRSTSRHAEAESLFRRALGINENYYGLEHPNVALNLNNLGLLLRATSRYSEAEPLLRRALAINQSHYGTEHSNVALNLNNLGLLLRSTGRPAEAEPLFRRALVIDERIYGPNHPNVALKLNNLADILRTTGRYAEAEPLFHRALAIDERCYGSEHPSIALKLNNLGLLLADTQRPAEAEPLFRRALRILLRFEQLTGHRHQDRNVIADDYAVFTKNTLNLTEGEANARVREVLGLDSHPDPSTEE